jgi:hypothetical protein
MTHRGGSIPRHKYIILTRDSPRFDNAPEFMNPTLDGLAVWRLGAKAGGSLYEHRHTVVLR